MLKKAKLELQKIEYCHGSATQLAPDKSPNNKSVFSVHVLEPEDRPGLVLEDEIPEGGSHCSDLVASEHNQIPVFATTVEVQFACLYLTLSFTSITMRES